MGYKMNMRLYGTNRFAFPVLLCCEYCGQPQATSTEPRSYYTDSTMLQTMMEIPLEKKVRSAAR